MTNCKELNIQLCPACDDTSPFSDCWIEYWKQDFSRNTYLSVSSYITVYNNLLTNIIDTNYRLYFREAAKIYYPELYDKLLKLMILE
jgi:hypothetical protein